MMRQPRTDHRRPADDECCAECSIVYSRSSALRSPLDSIEDPSTASPMSELGQSRRFDDVRATSALPLITDLRQKDRHVRFVP
jgi:hypothetical protein